eukprot:scaffold65780_cov44-Attheya_sp.AAC.1
MVLRPGGGSGGGRERRCIRIVEGAVFDFVSLQYQFCTAAHVEAVLLLFYYSQISRGPGGEPPARTTCYARLPPAEVMIFEPSLWPQACENAARRYTLPAPPPVYRKNTQMTVFWIP